MKRLGLLLAVVGLAAIGFTTASASTDAGRAICHRTGSKTNPYVKIKVSAVQLRAHNRHAADIIPAPKGGCPKAILTATSGGRTMSVSLVGEADNPAGDPVATGTATLHLRAGQGQVCYQVVAKDLAPSVGAHIHRGAAGSEGPVVVPLTTPSADGSSTGCAAVARTLVASILAQPAGFYVNVHTDAFPAGAIRGQLVGTSADTLGTVKELTLQGTSEPNAKGTAVLRLRQDAGLVCYRLHAESVTLPTTGAHIHRGAAGVNGPVVVPFTAPGADGNSSGCATASADLINEIVGNPAGFYVNVHTKEHPAGAIRSQLG